MEEMQFFMGERNKRQNAKEQSIGKLSQPGEIDDLIDWAKALPDDVELSGGSHNLIIGGGGPH